MSEGSSKTGRMKDAFYFPHDFNARHDPKIEAMMIKYKASGYGWWWMLLEILGEQGDNRLQVSREDDYKFLAREFRTTARIAEQFVRDCVEEYGLFEREGDNIYSRSFDRRMAIREAKRAEKSQQGKRAADARWGNTEGEPPGNAVSGMQTHSGGIADAMQGKESKPQESRADETTSKKKISEQTRGEASRGNKMAEAQELINAHLGVSSIWAEDNSGGDSGEAILDDSLFYVTHAAGESLMQSFRLGSEQEIRERLWELHDMFDAEDFDTLPRWLNEKFQRKSSR